MIQSSSCLYLLSKDAQSFLLESACCIAVSIIYMTSFHRFDKSQCGTYIKKYFFILLNLTLPNWHKEIVFLICSLNDLKTVITNPVLFMLSPPLSSKLVPDGVQVYTFREVLPAWGLWGPKYLLQFYMKYIL